MEVESVYCKQDSLNANCRIDWIDTAKGICIMLVVLHHCSLLTHASYPMEDVFMTFRMPLYFILSGLFFKKYNFRSFMVKKANKLLIPYVFFYVFTGVLIPVLIYRLFGYSLAGYYSPGLRYGFKAIRLIFSESIIVNPSIWFIFCLFEVNVLFYILFFISGHFKRSNFFLGVLALVLGIIGLILAYKKIGLPYYVDSSLTVLPFFYFGYFLRNNTTILSRGNSIKSICFSIIFIVVSMLIIYNFNFGVLTIICNTVGDLKGFFLAYPYGIIGTLSVLFLSKILGKIPFVSYIGRYSIIVLCIHAYVMYFVYDCLSRFVDNDRIQLLVVFLGTILICFVLIPFFKKYLAYFTAQKDLIKLG